MRNKSSEHIEKYLNFEKINHIRGEVYEVSKRIKDADLFVNEKQLENIKDKMNKIAEFK